MVTLGTVTNQVVTILPHYTYADWELWEGQWELNEGIPHAMRPLPVPRHQQIAASLTAEFHFQLKSCKKCAAYQPLDNRVTDDIILQPDMLIVCDSVIKKYLDFPPAPVAVILSPATFLKYRHTKFSIYQSQGIKYYLIISPETEEVEVYLLVNGNYIVEKQEKNLSILLIWMNVKPGLILQTSGN